MNVEHFNTRSPGQHNLPLLPCMRSVYSQLDTRVSLEEGRTMQYTEGRLQQKRPDLAQLFLPKCIQRTTLEGFTNGPALRTGPPA